MKQYILLFPLILMSCGNPKPRPEIVLSKPVQIPDLPSSLSKKAESLPAITDNSMGSIVSDSANTSSLYNDVSHRLNNLIDFYDCVKISINNKSDINGCLK